MSPLVKVLQHISTHADGTTYDVGRIIGWVGSLAFIFMGVAQLVNCMANSTPENFHHFDFIGFGTGFGLFAGGCGGLIWLKKGTEPTVSSPERKE